MTNGENYESKLWKILSKEQLADLAQYHEPNFFDEVPLFSRMSDIEFLPDHPAGLADSILLAFALKLLNAIIAYEEHKTPFFAAITAWGFPESDRIIPNLLVRSGSIGSLKKKLALDEVESSFGRKVQRMVRQTHLRGPFDVLEDSSEGIEEGRVFIAPAIQPYPAFVTLGKFRKRAGSVSR